MKPLKTISFLLCILWGTVLTAQINDSEKTIVANIRRQYAQAHEVIKQQQDDVQMHNNAVLMFNHNVPGIGPQTFKYEYFFTPLGSSPDGNHHLLFVQCSYNVAARKYYEEFLYDDNGDAVFLYAVYPNDDGGTMEMRCYFYDHLILLMTVTQKQDGKSQILFEGRASDGSVSKNPYDFNEVFTHESDVRRMFNNMDSCRIATDDITVNESQSVIATIFCALPDSVSMGGDRPQMVEGSRTFDKSSMTYDSDKYPDGIAVVEGNRLYWYADPMLDSVWDMQMWDTDNDNEKLVLVHCGANDTHYAYFYRYQVDTQTFFPAQEVFETPAYQDLIDKNFLSSVELEAGRKMFDDCRKWWGNQVLIYVLSSDDTFEVCLSELVLVNCEEATFNGSEFRRLMYRWNGKRFTLQQ